MGYEAKNYDSLLGTPGFSDTLLTNHFTLYQGYVKNVNALLDKLDALDPASAERAELQRRFGWEWNGMRLHELSFENMANGGAGTPPEELAGLVAGFRSIAAMRGIGWVVMYRDPVANRTFNAWVNEHDVGHLAGCVPLLVMDVFEHAYVTDYGIKRADYIEAFMKSIDWTRVTQRLSDSTT